MIDREHDLSVTNQAEILGGSAAAAFTICRVQSLQPISRSCSGSIGCTWIIPLPVRVCCEACWLCRGCKVGRRHVKTLMRRMGIEALYRRPRTTKPFILVG
jgi:putative transposase